MSLALNLGGYFKAIMWALPLGFLIGLIPFFNGAFQKIVDSLRFLPLTAITSLFIIWFGIGSAMKMNFLAFGIIIYLLPTIVQRINEVDDVYIKTVHTLGASSWQKVWSVYFPSVISKLIDDIRVLTAISWTYIIVIENIGSQKGLGQLIWSTGQRQARADVIFAVLILIMVIGVFQDRIFSYLDRVIFPYKYQAKVAYGQANLVHEVSIWDNIFDYVIQSLQYIFIGIYILLAINEVFPFLGELKPLSYLFGDRLWVIHVLFVLILILVFKKPIKMLIQRVWKY
ncbi:MAG TPA: ABC transporter permease subunit [Saprospiraceae bacterium]|nr:ABC transporter permease subunit [Saprospiraceae bacterium]